MVQQVNKGTIGGLQGKVLDVEVNEQSERAKAGEGQSPIRQFYRGRSIFITGATGFIGKVLVEKIARCCPEIERMYLLLRPKRGMNPQERLEKLLKADLFRIVREQNPSYHEKITVVYGDIENPNLGVGDHDLEILKEKVSIIFHSAARVRYDDHLRVAAHHHLTATKRLMELCRQMPKLVSVIYVSTAYVHREPDYTVPEKVVPCDMTPDELLHALQWMDDETVSKITPFLLRDKFNNYFLTKALTENIISENHKDIPLAIVRPCVVGSTWKDPFPGWCDTLQGPGGLLLAAAKGFLRTLYSIPGLTLAVIPSDIVVKTMITTAWFVAQKRQRELFVVNCVHDDDKLLPAGEQMLQAALDKREDYPLYNFYRYPDFTLYYSRTLYKIHDFFDQFIPAYLIDILLYIFTGKPFMVRLYRRIESIYNVFVLVAIEPWIMKNENFHALKNALKGTDKESFDMDMNSLDWADYIDICLRGGRKYLAHEDESNIPLAKRKAKIWWFVTTVLKWIIIFGLMYYIFCRFLSNYIDGV